MSVLVIGATGFIGPRLIRRLVTRGDDSGNCLANWSRLSPEFGIEYPGLYTACSRS